MSTLAERLVERTEETGVTQAQIARACKIKPPSVADWFNGKTKNLKGANLVTTAKLLKVEEAWLASGVGPKERRSLEWPFKSIDQNRFARLPEHLKGVIEGRVLGIVEEWERSDGKSQDEAAA